MPGQIFQLKKCGDCVRGKCRAEPRSFKVYQWRCLSSTLADTHGHPPSSSYSYRIVNHGPRKDKRPTEQGIICQTRRESCFSSQKGQKIHCTEKDYSCKTSLDDQGEYSNIYRIIVFLTSSSQSLTAKINKSIEQQMVSAASSGKLTIMKNVAPEGYAESPIQLQCAYSHLPQFCLCQTIFQNTRQVDEMTNLLLSRSLFALQ